MKKFFRAALVYTFLGLAAGVVYRTLTAGLDERVFTQLNVTHTHLLVLGTIMMLVFLVLERLFALSRGKWHGAFWWTYNIALVLTVAMMVVNGLLALNGVDGMTGMRAGISGIGHILITVAFVFFFLNLGSRLKAVEAEQAAEPVREPVNA